MTVNSFSSKSLDGIQSVVVLKLDSKKNLSKLIFTVWKIQQSLKNQLVKLEFVEKKLNACMPLYVKGKGKSGLNPGHALSFIKPLRSRPNRPISCDLSLSPEDTY
ncbi:hypothetical protein ANANG_G00228120 [Anguilla anguilla]|uniref:Uncharacterized protein n=1 Tax=Anguilla anguilla TaxID=7936 RepID=A0A9D3RQC1_ANGAN|nr:hypothetical protein ANANG_G00228120 [Anguilla anguilla]